MRALFVAAVLLAVTACAWGGAPPPSPPAADAEDHLSRPPCFGTAGGECPSGNPIDSF